MQINALTIIMCLIWCCLGVIIAQITSHNLTEDKLQMVQSWLIYAVAMAEQTYGDGTGKLKLAMVYNEFAEKMPTIARYITYEKFDSMVQVALQELNNMLRNQSIESIIKRLEKE